MTKAPLFRQLFDAESSTYTYLLADPQTKEAVLIDPVREQAERDQQLLMELGLTLRYTLETHVHADHITSSGLLRERCGSQSVVSVHGGVVCGDVQIDEGGVIAFGDFALRILATPGHTDSCVSYLLEGGPDPIVFTGDALLIRGCGRTDFQQGDARRLFRSVREKLFALPPHTLIYPGHDYKGRSCSSVAEEMAHNPRLKLSLTEEEFVGIMSHLNLAAPKKIAEAVPMNLSCGLPTSPPSATSAPGPGPLLSPPR